MTRWRRVLVVAVATLLLAEGAVRVIASDLPDRVVWSTVEMQLKVGQIDELAAHGGADVVVAGSSVVNAGIEPVELGPALGGVAFNAALSAATPELLEPWLLDVVLPRLHPHLLVLGLTSFDLFDHPSAAVFRDAFLQSPAGSRAAGQERVLDLLDRKLAGVSSLWAHRRALRDPAAVLDALRGRTEEPVGEFGPVGPNGRVQNDTFRGFDEARFGPPVDGWTLGEENPGALRRLVDGARAEGIDVVLLIMPVTDEYVARHPEGEADYDEFRAAVHALGTDTGARVLDFDDVRDHRYFEDQVHMAPPGRELLTSRLIDALRTGSR